MSTAPSKSNQDATRNPVTFADELLGAMASVVRLMRHKDCPGSSANRLYSAFCSLSAAELDVDMTPEQAKHLKRIYENSHAARQKWGIG